MHMNYFGVTVIPRLPDILTVTAVEMILLYRLWEIFRMYEVLGKQIPSEGFCTFYHCRSETKEIAGMVEICPSYKYSADGSKIGILRIDLLPEYENERCLMNCLLWS